jgi:hypothetical protein
MLDPRIELLAELPHRLQLRSQALGATRASRERFPLVDERTAWGRRGTPSHRRLLPFPFLYLQLSGLDTVQRMQNQGVLDRVTEVGPVPNAAWANLDAEQDDSHLCAISRWNLG